LLRAVEASVSESEASVANLTGLATVGRGALAKPVGAMPEWATAQGAPGL